MIEVTAAIIHKNGKLLVCQRPRGKQCEMLWEFPGGKIEIGETPEECLIRECHEELGVTIELENFFYEIHHEYPDIAVDIYFYMAKIIDGIPSSIEHNDIKWCSLPELKELLLCPADKKMIDLTFFDIQGLIQPNLDKDVCHPIHGMFSDN